MKTKMQILSWFLVLVLALVSFGVKAENQDPTQTVCIGNQPYHVDATLPGTVYTWAITPGTDGTEWHINGSGSAITVDWLMAGDYTLTVNTSLNGCDGTPQSVLVHVQPPLGITILADNPGPVCAGTVIHFTSSVTNGTTSTYQWYVNGSAVTGATNATYDYTAVAPGADVYCEVTDPGACANGIHTATSNTVHIDVNAQIALSVSITSDLTEVCEGGTINFTATATPASGVTINYQWYVGTTAVGTNSPTFAYSGPVGTASITCVVSSTDNCVSNSPQTSNAIDVTVKPKPVTSPIWHN